jgi:hypothetical protein
MDLARTVIRKSAAVMLAWLLLPGQVAATDNLIGKWARQQWGIYNYSPCYVYESGFPTGSIRSRVSDARMVWNNVNTELWIGERTPCTYPQMKSVIVKYYDLWVPNNNSWAFVICNVPSTTSCNININKSPDDPSFGSWYWGTGSPGGSQVDGLSVMIHEWGHATPLLHSSVSTSDVMTPHINVGQSRRTLTTHDKNSLKANYPYPAQ